MVVWIITEEVYSLAPVRNVESTLLGSCSATLLAYSTLQLNPVFYSNLSSCLQLLVYSPFQDYTHSKDTLLPTSTFSPFHLTSIFYLLSSVPRGLYTWCTVNLFVIWSRGHQFENFISPAFYRSIGKSLCSANFWCNLFWLYIFWWLNKELNWTEMTASNHDLPDSNVGTPTSKDTIQQPTPTNSGASTRSRKNLFTPRKARLKKRLEFVTTSKAYLAQKYQVKISDLRTQLKTPISVINQSLKRKQKKYWMQGIKYQGTEI